MDTISLKEYIFKENKVEFILNEIGCHSIIYHPNKEYYSCGNYNGDNKGAINVKNNEYLNVTNWTRTKEFDDNSDIITLVQYNKNISFYDALKYIHKILDLKFTYKKEQEKKKEKIPKDILLMENIRNKTKYGYVNVEDIHVLDDKLIDDYIPLLHIDWVREGITERTRKKFGLAYSYKHKRVVIPLRWWATGELLGFNQRTTVENYSEFNIKKYYITPTYPKLINLYGLYENYDSIISKKIVTVFEGEKSTLKRSSLMDDTCVSLQGKTMSDEQVRILVGLNVEIVIALDKDVDINEIRHIAEKFYHIRPVSYIYDKWNLLDKKDAPVDKGNKIYQFLFEHRIKYDETEHSLYLQSLRKK